MRHGGASHGRAEIRQQRSARHRHDRRARLQRKEALEQVHVERLGAAREDACAAQRAGRGVLDRRGKVVDRRSKVPVRQPAALGPAGRAGRVQEVGRRGLVRRRGLGERTQRHLVRPQQARPRHRLVSENGHGAAVLHKLGAPRGRQHLVERQIHHPRAQHADEAHVRREAPRKCDGDDRAGREALQRRRERGALRVERRVAQLRAGTLDRDSVRRARRVVRGPRSDVGVPRRRRTRHERPRDERRVARQRRRQLVDRRIERRAEHRVDLRQQQRSVRRTQHTVRPVQRKLQRAVAAHAHLERQRVLYRDAEIARRAKHTPRRRRVLRLEHEKTLEQRAVARDLERRAHVRQRHRRAVAHRAVERVQRRRVRTHRAARAQVDRHRERRKQRAAHGRVRRTPHALRRHVAQQHALGVHVRAQHARPR